MDPFQALSELPNFIEEYKRVATKLAEVEKELAALKEDQYVTWDWICTYFDVTKATAMQMLADEKLFVYGQQIKRFKRSAILKFAERNSIKLKEVGPLPHQEKLLKGYRAKL